MALFRIRRPMRLLPGPRAIFGLRETHTTFDRQSHRAPADAGAAGSGFSDEDQPSMNDPRKQHTSVISLLIAAVVVLWLALFLTGHS